MAQVVLPNQVNYQEQLPSLISGVQNLTQVLNPVNGNVFKENSQIIIDFPSRGFIDGKSLYMSYNLSITAGTGTPSIPKTPLYIPFSRLDLYINNTLIESINDYNLIACLWVDLMLGPNEKSGLQSAFGYGASGILADTAVNGATATLLSNYDGSKALTASVANNFKFSGPIPCSMLSSLEKFFPAFAAGAVRMVFTLESLNNITTYLAANRPTAYEISNFQITYDMIDMGAEVEQSILQLPQVVIKSSGYVNQSITVPSGTAGNNSYVFNTRLASIRNAILYASSAASTTFVNGKFDAPQWASGIVATTASAFFSLNIGGVNFPQAGPLNTLNSSAILMELRKATGNLYDWSKSSSINNVEFNYMETGANKELVGLTITSPQDVAKFYVGFDLNKINSSSNNMLNGTSSANSPIIAQVNYALATTLSRTLNLTCNYDAILTLDTRTKQISVLM